MLTQRLSSNVQFNEEFIDGLIDIATKHKGSCDEIWLASYFGFPPIKKHKEAAEKLAVVADKLRKAGLRVSLQITNTLGHGEYAKVSDCSGLVYEGSPAEKITNHDGVVLNYNFCYRGKNVIEYNKQMVSEYVKAVKPHTIWFDDDLRLNTHNSFHCFCDNCITQFNSIYGANFDRKNLVRETNYGDIEWRRKFIEYLRKGMYEFTYQLSKTAVETYPDINIGYQHGPYGCYTGYGLGHVFEAMKKASGKNPKSRPGGGAYSDYNPREIVYKAALISGQVSILPDYVEEIRPEIENLPDVPYEKSIAGTCAETSIYFACGANAMSYALMMRNYEPMSWHGEMFNAFSKHRKYWEQLVGLNKDTKQAGILFYMPQDSWKYQDEQIKPYLWQFQVWDLGYCWAPLGIPVSFDKSDDFAIMLQFDLAKMLSDEEILYLLDKPVITDGATLEMINKRIPSAIDGYAEPMTLIEYTEKFTSHIINKGFENKGFRIGTFAYDGKGYRIKGENIEPFGALHTVVKEIKKEEGEYPYGVLNAVVKTSKNAKWAVFGAKPWHSIISYDKRNQLVQAAEYISSKLLPAVVESRLQALVLPRIDKGGKVTSVNVTNLTIGDSGVLRIKIVNPKNAKFKFSCAEYDKELSAQEYDGGHLVEIPNLRPYETGTIIC